MKKLHLFLLFAFMGVMSSAFAQEGAMKNIYKELFTKDNYAQGNSKNLEPGIMQNLDLESWEMDYYFGTGESPVGWFGLSADINTKKTTDAQNGNYAIFVKSGMIRIPLFGEKLLPGGVEGEGAIAARPLTMSFWAKGNLLGNDKGYAFVELSKNDRVIGEGELLIEQSEITSTYKKYTVNITYSSSEVPDLVSVGVYSGHDLLNVNTGSSMYIDNFSFEYAPPSGPNAQLNTNSWNAGEVTLGNMIMSPKFTLTNAGEGTLKISSVSFSSFNFFTWTTGLLATYPTFSLTAGQSCDFDFTFMPMNIGDNNATLKIVTNGGTLSIALSGKGKGATEGETTIIGFTPFNEGNDITLDAVVAVIFDRNVTANDLSGTLITPDPGNVSASISGNKIIISHNNFAPNTLYAVYVPPTAISNFPVPIAWGFLTGTKLIIPDIEKNNIYIYPNPTTGKLTIDNGKLTIDNVKIIDIMGKQHSFNLQISEFSNFQVDISHLPAGIYFVKVNDAIVKVIKY